MHIYRNPGQNTLLPEERKQLNYKLLQVAMPIAFQGMIISTLGMIDNLMVGFLGEVELAAVGIANQLPTLHMLFIFGLISGSGTFIAQFFGAKDMPHVRKSIGLAWVITASAGAFFFLLCNLLTKPILSIFSTDPAVVREASIYLRTVSPQFLLLAFCLPTEFGFKATQQTKLPLFVSFLTFSTNTILNYILIFGKCGAPALGVKGAAIATVIARSVEVLVDLRFLLSHHNIFCGTLRSYFGWSRDLVRRILKNSVPTTANEMLWSLGQSMYAVAFNRIGTTAYAAFQAAMAISNVLTSASFSIGDAALILTGEKLGQKDKAGAWMAAKHILKIGVLSGISVGILIGLFSGVFAGLFRVSAEGKSAIAAILLIVCFVEPLGQYNALHTVGFLRGGGDTRFAAVTEIACVWLIGVPLAFISAYGLHLPVHLAFLLAKLEEIGKFLILTPRFLSGKWMRNVIHHLEDDA